MNLISFQAARDRWVDRGAWRMVPWWVLSSKSTVRLALLRVLSVGHHEQLDMAPLLQHLADDFHGRPRRTLLRLARRVEQGAPLISALEQTSGVLSDEDLLTIRFATQTGTLPDALAALQQRHSSAEMDTKARIRQSVSYAITLAMICLAVTAFLMIFIAPTYTELFGIFGLGLPPAFEALINLCNGFVGLLPSLAGLLLLVIVLCWLFQPVQWLRRGVWSSLFRPAAQLRTAHVLRMLSLAMHRGRPLSGSVSTLARYHFDRGVRLKLLEARNYVEQGTDPWSSLAETGLLTPEETQSLQRASSPQLRTWIMDKLAEWREERVRQRGNWLSTLIHPVLVLVFGGIVLWVSLAFFSILTLMINALA